MAALLAVLVLLPAHLAVPSAAEAATCPNEARRVEQGTVAMNLPDCRAFELASPGSILAQDLEPTRPSVLGGAIAYYTPHPATSADSSGPFYLASRGPGGWSVESVAPQDSPAALQLDECEQNVHFSPDLSMVVDEEGWFEASEPAHCKRNAKVIVPGELFPYRNVFLHEIATGSNQLLNLTPEEVAPANAKFQDASDDFQRIVFSEEAQLTADSPAGYNFYLWADGAIRLLTVLPNGTPAPGELVEATGHKSRAGATVPGSGFAPLSGAVSGDGKRIYFYAGSGLYLRENADRPQSAISAGGCTEPAMACTRQIDASQGPGPGGGGVFAWASSDGSKVFFTAESRLTADSTAEADRADLYEYDVDSGQLTDLTADGAEAADVRGVSGAAEDGSYIYFVANGVLASGASPGSCNGAEAPGQQCNLYLAHGGSIDFIATLAQADKAAWRERTFLDSRRKPRGLAANASPSGAYLAFGSIESLTGYDNRDIDSGNSDRQIFLYDAVANGGEGQLSCASCIPDGSRPSAPVGIAFDVDFGPFTPGGNASWKANAVLDDGRVFFDSEEALVKADSNGRVDVYQYEKGSHRLISSGTHAGASRFMGVTPDGADLFFRTPQPLLGSDRDGENASLYDARVGGGFLEPPPSPPACNAEGCRAAAVTAPPFAPQPTATRRAGNPKARPAKGGRRCRKKRRHGRACQRRTSKRGTRRPQWGGRP
jgi:Tol biopolymer transport system component